jgi:hypothetical protein
MTVPLTLWRRVVGALGGLLDERADAPTMDRHLLHRRAATGGGNLSEGIAPVRAAKMETICE